MPSPRLPHVLFRVLARLLPRRLHTGRIAAEERVSHLTKAQREELARNLRGMLRPKLA